MSKVLASAIASPTNAPSVRIFFFPSSGLERLALLYAQRLEHRHEETVAVLNGLEMDDRRDPFPVFHPARRVWEFRKKSSIGGPWPHAGFDLRHRTGLIVFSSKYVTSLASHEPVP